MIKIINQKASLDEIKELAQKTFGDMVKAVVDVEKKIFAIGGELHADCEKELLENGSHQENLWGINIYPEKSREDWIEFTSLINVRPSQGNASLAIQDEFLRKRIKDIINSLIL